jgi:hypothetical protein
MLLIPSTRRLKQKQLLSTGNYNLILLINFLLTFILHRSTKTRGVSDLHAATTIAQVLSNKITVAKSTDLDSSGVGGEEAINNEIKELFLWTPPGK